MVGDKLHLKYNLRNNNEVYLGNPTNAIFTSMLTIFAKALGYNKVGNLATSILASHIQSIQMH